MSSSETHPITVRIVVWTITAMLAVAGVAFAQELSFESVVQELASKDADVRARSADRLRTAAYPEAAVPMATLVGDPVDEIQMTAIGAELNMFLAEKVTPKKRVGFIVERRGNLSAEAIFNAGPSVLGARRVPLDVPLALAQATADHTLRVAGEALYAFGALAGEVAAAERPTMLSRTAPAMVALLRSPDPTVRMATLIVVARVFAPRASDPALDERLGDAVIATLNSYESPVRETAMWTLGVLRYERSVQALGELMTYYRKGPLAERAFDSIARIGHPANTPQFVEQLNGRNLMYRLLAIEGIARTGDKERHAEVQAVVQREKNDAVLLAGHFANVALADGPVDVIVEALDRERLRPQALQYVHELAPGRAPAFGSLIRPPNGKVRVELIDALGLSGDSAAVAVLQPFLEDSDPDASLAAQRAMARLRR